ncbi:MAG: PIG-L deacetylase family protein [Gemmataceae bacterium]
MPKTLLAIGAHYDDCVFGIPGILLQAVRKHYRVVVLSIIGDYSNWTPVRGREKELIDGTTRLSRDLGVETRYLKYASHRFEVTEETKRAVSEVVADVQPDVGFLLWRQDRHRDHEVAAELANLALRHGDRLLAKPVPFKAPRSIYAYDNGPRHTIGFEPNTYVDISAEWEQAIGWLGRFMALVANKAYDGKDLDGAQRAKEALARYRGQACGVRYAEAVWSANLHPQDIL